MSNTQALAPETGLTARLAEWIKAEGITGHYDTDGIAARVVASSGTEYVTRCLDAGGTNYLRGLCARIKDDLTDAEAWAEDWHHGNLRDDLRAWSA